jgi:peroxiredoxin
MMKPPAVKDWKFRLTLLLPLIAVLIAASLSACAGPPPSAASAPLDTRAYYPNNFISIPALKGFGVGEVAPDFSFLDNQRQMHSLDEFRGKAVLINFWSSRCPPCREEFPIFQQVFSDNSLSQRGVELLTVNLDEDSQSAVQFIQDNRYSFPFILDSTWKIGQAYGVFEYPSTFLVDQRGVIQVRKEGPFSSQSDLLRSLDRIAL